MLPTLSMLAPFLLAKNCPSSNIQRSISCNEKTIRILFSMFRSRLLSL